MKHAINMVNWFRNKFSHTSYISSLQVAEEVLAMSISLTPDQIIDLAQQINQTVQGLQNIDSILNATSSDLAKAQRLKQRAETAE